MTEIKEVIKGVKAKLRMYPRVPALMVSVSEICTFITTIESQKEEIDNFKSCFERMHDRVKEALADQPDDYASYLAVLDIQAIIEHRKELTK